MLSNSGSAKSFRTAEELKRIKVFVPAEDQKSWVPAVMDVPRGTWCYPNIDLK